MSKNMPDYEVRFAFDIQNEDSDKKTHWVNGGAFWRSEDKPGLLSGHVIITSLDGTAVKLNAILQAPQD